ncbi:SRPBCC family protein [Prauserella oleivorans]|uniref:SRPBCC family protein n=1 Tax=Prauserella oleivorans TaxID=1478153 RepID=A0ABW5WK77_9PSEU
MAAPDAQGEIDVDAPAERVYALVSDPGVLAELAGEYHGHRWLGGATEARPGARFRGHNRNGFRRWSTTCTVTDAEEGSRFAFEVTFGPLRISRWQYDLEPRDGGCRVVERTWDRRPDWFRTVTGPVLGVRDRAARNHANIQTTLTRLKARAES